MSATTSIEWTNKTWNPVVGCDQISPGCARCYAKTQWDRRHKAFLAGKTVARQYSQPFEVVQLMPERLMDPLSWRTPQMVFVNSVSDLFHEDVPNDFIDAVWGTMLRCPQHTFQILTKRPARMKAYFDQILAEAKALGLGRHIPNPNVWLGVSCENQRFADERIPLLLQTPAAVRWVSAEPLLGPIDFSGFIPKLTPWKPYVECRHGFDCCPICDFAGGTRLDWVVVGGESGPGARPCALEWIESIVQQCRAAGVAPFVKQLGAYVVSEHRTAPSDCYHPLRQPERAPNGEHWAWRAGLRNKKGGDITEFPKNLQVREYPRTEAQP